MSATSLYGRIVVLGRLEIIFYIIVVCRNVGFLYSDVSVGGMLKRKSVLREKRFSNKIKATRKV